MWKHEIDNFLLDIVIRVESASVIRNVMDMLRTASYLPAEPFFAKAVSAYMIAYDGQERFDTCENDYQVEKTVKTAGDTSVVLQTLTHFNSDNGQIVELVQEQVQQLVGLLADGRIKSESLLVNAKFTLMRYLRHTALFNEHQSDLSSQAISALFKHVADKLTLEDFHQLAQILQLHGAPTDLLERVIQVNNKVERIKGSETIISKFQ